MVGIMDGFGVVLLAGGARLLTVTIGRRRDRPPLQTISRLGIAAFLIWFGLLLVLSTLNQFWPLDWTVVPLMTVLAPGMLSFGAAAGWADLAGRRERLDHAGLDGSAVPGKRAPRSGAAILLIYTFLVAPPVGLAGLGVQTWVDPDFTAHIPPAVPLFGGMPAVVIPAAMVAVPAFTHAMINTIWRR